MNICCRCYRYSKKTRNSITFQFFLLSSFFSFPSTLVWETLLFRLKRHFRVEKKRKIPNIVLRHTYIQTFIHLHRIADKKEKNFAMNGKADVFFFVQFYFSVQFFAFIHWCLCFHFLFVLFLCRFIPLSVSYAMLFFSFGWHTHTHSSLSFISHFSSFSRLVHCLDTTSLMQYSLFFVRRFIRFHLRFHTLVMYIQFSLIQPTTAAMATTTMTKTTTTQWRPNECHCSPCALKCMKIHWVKVR